MRRSRAYVIGMAAALVLSACGGDGDAGGAAPTTPAATTEPVGDAGDAGTGEDPAADVTLATADSDLGTILVDGEGRTLYVFDNDSGGESSCYDTCAQNWPPLTGEAAASGDVDADLVGTTERTDGSVQVTYDGQPLYHYAADAAPGDTNGQGVGDIWWVVGPDGGKITGTSEAAAVDTGY